MKRFIRAAGLLAALWLWSANGQAADALTKGWQKPPPDARLRAYWWWLNGNVTKTAITRDLEQMKAKGFAGAVLLDADGSSQDGNERVPHGPTFFSAEWRELYKHTLREARRLDLEISLNILSGWNLGGPSVKADDAAKKLTSAELQVTGPTNLQAVLPLPKTRDGYYRDAFVVAFPIVSNTPHRPLQNWAEKTIFKPLPFSAPKTTALFAEFPAVAGEGDARSEQVVDLTSQLEAGKLAWQVPPGEWQILRFGYTIGDHSYVSTCSEGWNGYALDVLDAGAFQRYWDTIVEPLIADAGPLAGKTLKYLHTDSWEVEPLNWTPTLPQEFRKRRGYDMLPFTPVLAGRIVNSRAESDRFLHDFRKTLGDLAIDHHYRIFRDNAHRHGLLIHPESGGPHAVPIDAQRCLGWDDAPMSEFWAWSWRHRVGDDNRFFVKQPASAAHTYGRKLVLAEGFTTIGPHWQETIWDNLKPAFDKALCEGLNVLVWHAFVCSPEEMGMPGQQYFAGTHLNPNVTWWSRSTPFFEYINRCQWMLQQGHFVADVCCYYGDHVPNFAQHKHTDPAQVLPGYDYDVITEEALLTRLSVKEGRLALPDGMSYRVMVLPERTSISLPVLRKLNELARAGAIVIGPKPFETEGLEGYPACDDEVRKLASGLWGNSDAPSGEHRVGLGRVISGQTARAVLLADGVPPDCEFTGTSPGAMLDYIHRREGPTDIYFLANRSNRVEAAICSFRQADRVPELWDAVSGEHHTAVAFKHAGGRTEIPLQFPPCGSLFVVFRSSSKPPRQGESDDAPANAPNDEVLREIRGPWTVRFDPKWGGPKSATFEELVSWSTRPEPGIKFYSGTATYVTSLELPSKSSLVPKGGRLFLNLGAVRELAEVKVNGRSCGILWTPPFRADITGAVKSGQNSLEIDVVNFWPNRIIGDQSLPPERRLTRTNIRKLTAETPLIESGLFGPVTLESSDLRPGIPVSR